MKNVLFYLLFLSVLISACQDDDTVASRTIFTFKGLDVVGGGDWWVIIHDGASGDLIDSKQVFPNATTTFESTRKIAGGKLIVTFFLGTTSPIVFGTADSYSDVDVGSTWAYGRPLGMTPATFEYGGDYSLKITDVPSLFTVNTSDLSGETNYTSEISYSGNSIFLYAFTSNASSDQMVVVDTGVGNPKYTMIKNTSPQDLTMSYTTLKDFDKYVKVTFPETTLGNNLITAGYKHPRFYWQGYTLQHNHGLSNHGKRTELSIGFLNAIPNYYLRLEIDGWRFHSEGNPPASIEYVSSVGYAATATSPDDFKITTSKDYVYSLCAFGYQGNNSSLDLTCYSPKGKEKAIYPLTPEIESKYSIDRSSMKYLYTEFMVKGRSYAEMVSQTFAETTDANRTFQESFVADWRY